MITRPLIFLDVESTGTDTANDRIIELCLIKVTKCDCPCHGNVGIMHIQACCNGGFKEEIKTKRFNPEMPIPESSTAIHGITDEMVKDEKPFRTYAKAIHELLQGSDIVGFNSNSFDLPMLNNEFTRSGITWNYSDHNLIDIGNVFKILNPRTLTAAVKQYLGKDHIDAHSAEQDTIATKDVFFAMVNEQQWDLNSDLKDLALYSNYDRPILDLNGKFSHDKEGNIILTFGKYRGEKAADHLDFVEWMVRANFPDDTLAICYKLLGE